MAHRHDEGSRRRERAAKISSRNPDVMEAASVSKLVKGKGGARSGTTRRQVEIRRWVRK